MLICRWIDRCWSTDVDLKFRFKFSSHLFLLNDRFRLLESGQVGDVAALKSTTEELKQMLSEVEDALKEREEEVEMRREKNDEYNKLKKDVDGQLGKLESGKKDSSDLE